MKTSFNRKGKRVRRSNGIPKNRINTIVDTSILIPVELLTPFGLTGGA